MTVTAIDLGAAAWLVVLLGLAELVAGIHLVNSIKRRLSRDPDVGAPIDHVRGVGRRRRVPPPGQ